MSFIGRKCDGIQIVNSDENTEGFPVGTSDSELLGSLDSTMIGVSDSYKLKENLVVRKVHHLVYLSEILKSSLKVPCLVLLKEFLNPDHLEHLSNILKDLRKDLYLE